MATEVRRERIALLNKKRKVTLSNSGAFPGAAEREGVRVLFQLPLSALPA